MLNSVRLRFDVESFCVTNGVNYRRHRDWVQICCPMPGCYGDDYKGGFHTGSGVYSCWRCGTHRPAEVVSCLLRCDVTKALAVMAEYGAAQLPSAPPPPEFRDVDVVLPLGSEPLSHVAKRYLNGRGLDADALEQEWGLLSTPGVGRTCHRVIIPIHYRGELASWTARSYVDDPVRYISCSAEGERWPHKTLLYGWDKVRDVALVVEGPTDVWNIGPGAVCVFGTEWCSAQLDKLRKCGIVYVMFDPEPRARESARSLVKSLSLFLDNVEQVTLDNGKDPGSLSLEEVVAVRKELGLCSL